MKSLFFLAITIVSTSLFFSQGVGIGTDTPSKTLEIAGNMKLSGNLYLENPGNFTGNAANSYLIVRDNADKALKRYVPATAQYGAINSTVYYIKNISSAGLADFDTGIPTDKYYLVIGGFIVRGVNNDSNISISQPANTSQYIPMYSARSFQNNGTWHIKFVPNNNRVFDQNPEMRLSVSIYRRDMLTTVNSVINVNMNAVNTGIGTAPAPNLP